MTDNIEPETGITYSTAPAMGSQLGAEGITSGCATNPLRYCPDGIVTRESLAVLLLRTRYGSPFVPPPYSTYSYNDIATSSLKDWIQYLASEMSITDYCSGISYCPTSDLTRERLAHFIAYAFDLPMAAAAQPLVAKSQGGGHFASYILAPAQQGGSLTFTPVADAYLSSGSPSNNHGSSTTLQIDKSPDMHFLLKFTVTGVNGQPVSSAKIRLYNVNGSVKGGDFYRVSDNTWQEGTVNWNNAPAADATPLATLGSVSANTWVEVDVTSLIAGDGTYSLRARSGPPPPIVRIILRRKGPTRSNW